MIRAFKYLSFLNVGCNITKNNRGIKVIACTPYLPDSCSITRNNRGIKGTIKDSRRVKRSEEK